MEKEEILQEVEAFLKSASMIASDRRLKSTDDLLAAIDEDANLCGVFFDTECIVDITSYEELLARFKSVFSTTDAVSVTAKNGPLPFDFEASISVADKGTVMRRWKQNDDLGSGRVFRFGRRSRNPCERKIV